MGVPAGGRLLEPSLALARRLGFQRIGEHLDEVDGLEHNFQLELPAAERS